MVEITCFGLEESNPNVCSGKGNCTYLNFCKCLPGFDGIECQTLAHIDFRDVMFGFSIAGPIVAVVLSILIFICFTSIICLWKRKKAKERKEQEKKTASDRNNMDSADKVMRFNQPVNNSDDIQRSPTHSYTKAHPFSVTKSNGRNGRSDEALVRGTSKSPKRKPLKKELGKSRTTTTTTDYEFDQV